MWLLKTTFMGKTMETLHLGHRVLKDFYLSIQLIGVLSFMEFELNKLEVYP
jgi:hypothetical protein